MRIEVGAGGRAAPGYLAVDLNPRRCDVVAAADQLPFRTGSITALRAVDVLEHVSYRDTDRVLDEWARVCCPAAQVYIQVPDADTIMQRYVLARRAERGMGATNGHNLLPIPADQHLPDTALAGATWRLLGGHADGERVGVDDDWRWNAHYAFFSRESLTAALDRAGFRVRRMIVNDHPNLCCDAQRK